MTSIARELLGQTRSAVLSLLLLRPEASLHVRELARLTGVSAGSLHRELRALAALGLLIREEIGRQVHYRANPQSPAFDDLAGLLRKTAGVGEVLREALAPLSKKISLAFIYGSVAAGLERADSDVDLMVLGSASFADLARALAGMDSALHREVNPTSMPVHEFADRLVNKDGFATSVMASPHIWLIGAEDDLAERVAHRKTERTPDHGRRSRAAAGRRRPQPV